MLGQFATTEQLNGLIDQNQIDVQIEIAQLDCFCRARRFDHGIVGMAQKERKVISQYDVVLHNKNDHWSDHEEDLLESSGLKYNPTEGGMALSKRIQSHPVASGVKCHYSRPVILLAEDDVIVRNLVRLLLEHDGYQLLVGADGAEALALARSYVGVIDLLLTDIEMPRMNGLELSQQIIAERPGIRVLVMSGQTSDSFRKLNFKFPFLNKPFVVESFRQKVREALADPPGGQQVT